MKRRPSGRFAAVFTAVSERLSALVTQVPKRDLGGRDWRKAAPLLALALIGCLLGGLTLTMVERPPPVVGPPSAAKTQTRIPPTIPAKLAVIAPSPVEPLVTDATGFGADLGGSTSLPELSDTFMRLRLKLPDHFADLSPLIRLADDPDDLKAMLVAGPFADIGSANNFCRVVRLQLARHCETTAYRGDALAISPSR